MTMRWLEELDPFDPGPRHGCATCDHCGRPVAAELIGLTSSFADYWPRRASGKAFPDVPDQIASTASEAHICLSAGSPRGAAALARAVVESVAKHVGITKGTLEAKINALHSAGHISTAMMEAAHEIRFAGNEVAHGDLVTDPLSPENAEEIVSLMDTILERVFHEPAKVKRIRDGRVARKNPQPAEATAEAEHGPPL